MGMGISRVSCVALVLPLLFTSLARAQSPATASPPAGSAPAPVGIPIELHGAEPNLRLEIQDLERAARLSLRLAPYGVLAVWSAGPTFMHHEREIACQVATNDLQ